MSDRSTDMTPPSLRIRSVRDARVLVEHLKSPQSGLLGQLIRFGLAGGFVTLIYLAVTTALSQLLGLPFEAALLIGFCCALTLHFSLQRLFVWVPREEFALPAQHQIGRYLAMAGTQYGCTAASTAILPRTLGIPTELIYLGTMAIVTTLGFLTMRFVIFHDRASSPAA